jgi:hypothetical protein
MQTQPFFSERLRFAYTPLFALRIRRSLRRAPE